MSSQATLPRVAPLRKEGKLLHAVSAWCSQTPSASLVPLCQRGTVVLHAVSVWCYQTPSASLVPLRKEGQLICNAVFVFVFLAVCLAALAAIAAILPLCPQYVYYKKKSGDQLAATHIIGILCQLLNKYLFSLDNTVAVNCNNDVYTAYRSWDSCTCRCEVTYRNNLVTLNYEILD